MLSTNATSSIQKRRTQHRRQNSTPAALEAPNVRQIPGNNQRQIRHRPGMSLDLRGLNLEAMPISEREEFPETILTPVKVESFQQDQRTVSITNLGQPTQHTMQVAQTHSQPQPGQQYDYHQPSPVQCSPTTPRTPHRLLQPQPPTAPPLSPTRPPSEQQLKELQQHIESVYGSYGQVFINILPTPSATPQKTAHTTNHEPMDTALIPPNFSDIAELNLDPPPGADLNFSFDHPDSDMGYESSSYYTSDALSPGQSPTTSPEQKSIKTFLESVEEYPSQPMSFSQAPPLFPSMNSTNDMNGHAQPTSSAMSRSMSIPDLDVDASIEFTGIAPEDVMRFISEQDPVTNRWTCLYPDCDKTFGRRENIRSHVQTHLGDRQFRCNGCGKCFVRQHDLKRHAKIHTGDKPYKCPCSAGFARQDALTRHRQRGMCVGGFPDAVRRQAKRGRPKKNRPDMEDRVKKSNRTRRALASVASSTSGGSPSSDYNSVKDSSPFPELDLMDTTGLPEVMSSMDSFGDPLSSSSNPFSFDNGSTTFERSPPVNGETFASSSPYDGDEASMNLLRQLSAASNAQTPPMSPEDHESPEVLISHHHADQVTHKSSATPSRSSLQSNPFTTPPTSPVEPPRDDLDDIFNSLPSDNTCSQFDLEMKAMDDFTSFDSCSSSYELLDFM